MCWSFDGSGKAIRAEGHSFLVISSQPWTNYISRHHWFLCLSSAKAEVTRYRQFRNWNGIVSVGSKSYLSIVLSANELNCQMNQSTQFRYYCFSPCIFFVVDFAALVVVVVLFCFVFWCRHHCSDHLNDLAVFVFVQNTDLRATKLW